MGIKNQVSCSFGRDEDEKARGLIDTLNEKGYPSSQREWVEPSTLRAFIREQHEAGKELPMDLLGAFVGQKTTIKRIKEKSPMAQTKAVAKAAKLDLAVLAGDSKDASGFGNLDMSRDV